jgi:hypothetical protein
MIVLEFMFRSVWHFLGSIVLVVLLTEGIAEIIKSIRK